MTSAAAYRKILYTGCGLLWLSNAFATCKLDGLQITPAMINEFLEKPELLLTDDANSIRGAHDLSGSVAKYAAAAPAAIQALKAIIPRATLRQRAAIGAGLSMAVAACHAMDPLAAARLETAISSLDNGDVMAAYLRAQSLSGPPAGNSKPKVRSGFAPAKPPATTPGLIGEPARASPESLKLSDPFAPPDAWQ
jgi:hypothetical protein